MRSSVFKTLLIFCTLPCSVFAQFPEVFSDSLEIQPVTYFVTNRPDTFSGDTIFVLPENQGFVLEQQFGDTTVVSVFVKRKKSYKVFEADFTVKEESFTSGYSCDTVDFDGKGSKELIIRSWKNLYTSGANGHESIRTRSVALWNLDNTSLIFGMLDKDEYESEWNSSYIIDSTGERRAELLEENYCRNYNVEITLGQISVACDPDCAELNSNTGLPLPVYSRVYIYEQRGILLVLKNPEVRDQLVDSLSGTEMPDSFPLFQPEKYFVKSLDEISTYIVDTILDPLVYILEDERSFFCLGIRNDSGYVIYSFDNNFYTEQATFERVNFNKSGNPELVVRWTRGTGISTWTHGWAEHHAGIQIWDLDKMQVLFSFENYYSNSSWWQEFAEDTTGALLFEDREVIASGGESSCMNYTVTVGAKTVTIVQNGECPDQSDLTYLISDPVAYVYKLTPMGLVRKK